MKLKQNVKYIVIFILLFGFLNVKSNAVDISTRSAAPTDASNLKQIEDLKERLATKVAQLRQTQRQAIFGTVKSITLTSLTVETKTKDYKIEMTDDIKIFQILKGKRTSLAADDLSKGDTVVVYGEYDTTLDIMNAKVIFIQDQIPVRVWGTITEVNKTDFTITVKSADETGYIIDFENFTKAFEWSKDNGIGKSGFSKLISGNLLFILGTSVPNKTNRVSASRILTLTPPGVATSPATLTPTIEPNVKNTPTNTPKITPKPSFKPTPKTTTAPTSSVTP